MGYNLANRSKVLVAKNIARTTGISTVGAIADGEIVLADVNGTTLQGGTTYTQSEIQVVVRKDVNGVIGYEKTEPFKASQVMNYKVTPFTVDTQFIYNLGFDGVSGALEEDSTGTTLITEANTYGIRFRRLDELNGQFDKVTNAKTASVYASFTGYTQVDLAGDMYKQILDNFYNEIDYIFKTELLSRLLVIRVP